MDKNFTAGEKTKQAIAAAAVALLLGFLIGGSWAADAEEPEQSTQDYVREVLADFSTLYAPQSAVTHRLTESRAGVKAVCGQLNPVNQYGGHTGLKVFAIVDKRNGFELSESDNVKIHIEGANGEGFRDIEKLCSKFRARNVRDWKLFAQRWGASR